MSFKLRYICWPLRVSALYDLKFYKACCNRSYKYERLRRLVQMLRNLPYGKG